MPSLRTCACPIQPIQQQAFLLVQEMRETGVMPTEDIYLKLLDTCRQQRQGQAAVDVFEAMKRSGITPGVRSYTSLLQV